MEGNHPKGGSNVKTKLENYMNSCFIHRNSSPKPHPLNRCLTTRTIAWVGLVLTVSAISASAQSIRNMGVPPGGYQSGAYGVSANGSAVAVSVDIFGAGTAYRWTRHTGAVNLGTLPGASSTSANEISRDGGTLVGGSFFPDDSARAWRWTAAGGMQDLGLIPDGFAAIANGVNRNGSVVVGMAFTSDFTSYGFRWTEDCGMQSLGLLPGGTYSSARSVSDDGSTIIGQADSAGKDLAFRWTPHHGLQALPLLAPTDGMVNAFNVNQNGNIIAGFSGTSAVLWVKGVPRSLGKLPGDDVGIAFALNSDGSLVGGYSFHWGHARATLWTRSLGMVNLNTYLPQLGIDLSGWDLQYVRDVSADGTTLVGEGTYLGADRGWVVKLTPDHGRDDDNGEGKGRDDR